MSNGEGGHERTILIASSKIDQPNYERVGQILDRQGYRVVEYQADKVLSGEDDFKLVVEQVGQIAISYNGQSIDPGSVSAAWYGKVGSFDLPYEEPDLAKRQYINNEVRQLHGMIWSLYPEGVWLNSPQKIAAADQKLRQMIIGHQVGFSLVPTIVASRWESVQEEMQSRKIEKLAIKVLRGIINDGSALKAMYTHVLDAEEVDRLAQGTMSFPAYFRPYVEKSREWRITVVGDEVFSASIYTGEAAKNDWRKHQTASEVEFKRENSPDLLNEQCVNYLGSMGLRYGAFDFIESPDGEIVFLECNPNGQYGWLEDELGLPISAAIASELTRIAQAQDV